MAIVRILKSSKNFAAIKYNEGRCKRGEAELVRAVNFSINSSIMSHADYMAKWGVANTRIKNAQFHATISLEKDEMSKEELVKLGEKWLKEMGYGSNPYLIYYHKNTEHPHIHIVTTRVDKNGKKIDNNFENERAVKVLSKLENKPVLEDNRRLLAGLLRYSFSTKYQFIELCKGCGFKVWFDEEKMTISKMGASTVISNELIDFCSKRYHRDVDIKEKKRLQSLIYKYAFKYSRENFISYMHRKFGLEFIFYGKEGDINGYTIIDHHKRCIYKGSEIFGAKKIAELLAVPQSKSDIDLLIQDILDENVLCDFDTLNAKLNQSYFYSIDSDNQIWDLAKEEVVGELSPEFIAKLDYNKRVRVYADKFRPYNSELASIVARFAKVKVHDMAKLSTYPKPDESVFQSLNQLMKDALSSDVALREFLAENHLALVVSSNKYFLVDYLNGAAVSCDDLNVKYEDVIKKLQTEDELKQDEENTLAYEYDDLSSFLLNPPVFDFAGLFFTGHVSGAKTDKKKKKRL